MVFILKFDMKMVFEVIKKYKVILFLGVLIIYIVFLNSLFLKEYDIFFICVCISGLVLLLVEV